MLSEDTSKPDKLYIDVGGMVSVASFCFLSAKPLKKYTSEYSAKNKLDVYWDFRSLRPLHMDMSALTAFLSTAHRLRQYTDEAPSVLFEWNPDILTFFKDTKFLDLLFDYDLVRFKEGVVGGYLEGVINPATKFLVIEPDQIKSSLSEAKYSEEIKEYCREEVEELIIPHLSGIFAPRKNLFPLNDIQGTISRVMSELALNSILWGESTAFLGIQRRRFSIDIAVCDSGKGLLESLKEKKNSNLVNHLNNHSDALILSSIINAKGYGIRRLIRDVTELDGVVRLASYDTELQWRSSLWEEVSRTLNTNPTVSFSNIKEIIGQAYKYSSSGEKRRGFLREFGVGLRGVRASVKIHLPG
jgi:hypothetical protein